MDLVKDNILQQFHVGDKLFNSEIKEKIGEIYKKLGYKKTPKANALENFFEIRDIKVKEGNRWVHKTEILKQK